MELHLMAVSASCYIPRVPVWRLLYSYASGEVEEQTIKRVILPFAKEHSTDVVLI